MDKYQEIKEAFELLRDNDNAGRMSAYMRNKFKFYGIAAPLRKSAYKTFILEEKKGKSINWIFLDKCWDDEHREFQYLVQDYLKNMQKFLKYEDVPSIERYVRTKQWWDTIDGLDRIIGNIAFNDNRINALMAQWSLDEDFWVRRIAIDHQLCRKMDTNVELLEKILVNNFGSREFFINKAIGWSLRDYSKYNPEWVKAFLMKYRNRMSPLSIREASKYI